MVLSGSVQLYHMLVSVLTILESSKISKLNWPYIAILPLFQKLSSLIHESHYSYDSVSLTKITEPFDSSKIGGSNINGSILYLPKNGDYIMKSKYLYLHDYFLKNQGEMVMKLFDSWSGMRKVSKINIYACNRRKYWNSDTILVRTAWSRLKW